MRFVIGGIQKAGTSALANYLGAHPAIRLPREKEAHVFDDPDFDDAATSDSIDARFEQLFDGRDDAMHGDATPIYVLHTRFLERIARYNPAMRWIILLRDPAERAVSQYYMERARGTEAWPLWAAMLLEPWRLRGHGDDFTRGSPLRHHGYRLRGDYARQLDALHAHFPPEHVLLLATRELREDPTGTLRKTCGFLGIEPIPGALRDDRVFVGDYTPPPRDGFTMKFLRWLMRHERRAMRERYGLVFD